MVSIDPKIRAQLAAEASAWLVRLQSEARTPQTEAAFEAWLASTPRAKEAFERVSDVWGLLPDASLLAERVAANDKGAPQNRRWVMVAAAAGVAAVMGGAWVFQARPQLYETGVGETRIAVLSDGSRVSLNTDSRISVAYSSGRRQINFERGEAQFDVSPDARRPFSVHVSGQEVKALGTAFVVRSDTRDVAVTLIHGKVQISDLGGKGHPPLVLSPGERAILRDGSQAVVDRPSLSAVTAWQRGEVIFANTSLAEAVYELNRYSHTKIALSDERIAALRVSGVFHTGNPSEFAQSMAQLNGLKVRQKSRDQIELIR